MSRSSSLSSPSNPLPHMLLTWVDSSKCSTSWERVWATSRESPSSVCVSKNSPAYSSNQSITYTQTHKQTNLSYTRLHTNKPIHHSYKHPHKPTLTCQHTNTQTYNSSSVLLSYSAEVKQHARAHTHTSMMVRARHVRVHVNMIESHLH